MKKFFVILILFLILSSFLLPAAAQAFSLMDGVSPSCRGPDSTGDCSVCDIVRVIYNVGRFIFISMSGIALILFLWAGVGLIMNFGNAEMIASNKKLILHTLLALVIILAAYMLVNVLGFAFLGAGGSEFWQQGEPTLTGQPTWKWFEGPDCSGN